MARSDVCSLERGNDLIREDHIGFIPSDSSNRGERIPMSRHWEKDASVIRVSGEIARSNGDILREGSQASLSRVLLRAF